ncbi:hypothetical protein J1605_017733 [Eschrichtius robustus]|uniref:Uncharacterized protein n=1 Tax=Eschrichtius robustus TaxID=9764 RepID=A0AB34HYX8_ESCRO|nr:hypothetical protein J1605_017733 [Eschrichtius robustus]
MRTNTSVVTEFILIGFSHLAELQSLIFSFFLTVYLLTGLATSSLWCWSQLTLPSRPPCTSSFESSQPWRLATRPSPAPYCFTTSSRVSATSLALAVLSRCHGVLPPGSHGL